MSTLHALLIGIDDYLPSKLPDGSQYPSLEGPTTDVARMALLLKERAGLQPETTRMLLSRVGEDGAPTEPPERRPTYANIVAAFKQLAGEAKAGDRVYVHYSGHGARTPTEYPEIKGANGWDESWVPCDIGDPASRYLLDLELAALVRLLVDQDLRVTLVLDCCHAGGAMRGGTRAGRKIGKAVARWVPWVPRGPVPSAVADPQTLMEIWKSQKQDQRTFRGLSLQSSLPVARYALFAACRPDEHALEYPFDKGEPRGALTYWLIDTLERSRETLSCTEIHQRLVARIRGFFGYQTPMFIGDGREDFLQEPTRAPVKRALLVESPRVLRLNEETGQVLIDVGLPTGAKVGDRFRLNGSAELEIRRVGATESWAEMIRVLGSEEIVPGMKADFLRLQTAVRLVPPERESREADQALARLREALQRSEAGFVEVCDNGGTPDLCVTVDESDCFAVLDPGGTPFPNLSPLSIKTPGVIHKLIQRLDHLTKFRNILTVENPNPPDWLGIDLELREGGPEGASVPLSAGAVELGEGEELIVRIINRSSLRLDFTVLDLDPDYRVSQLLPKKGSLSLLPLDPGQAETVRIKGWLPAGFNEGNDVLKVFATQGAANFRWLELPPLEKPWLLSNLRGKPKNPLEVLFAQLIGHQSAKRGGGLNPSEFPEEEWITAQVEIRVRR